MRVSRAFLWRRVCGVWSWLLGVMGCGAAACVRELGGVSPGGGVLDTVSLSVAVGVQRESRGHSGPNVTGCHFHDIP